MIPRSRAEVELPSPRVHFGPGFRARVGRLLARLAAARERREGSGRAELFGAGSEFVGYRPYRSGEDLRALDWNLYARLGRPYVRVSAREATEDWAVLVDTSASMGVGVAGKLQLAAELATAFAALEDWLAVLQGVRAAGERGLAHTLAGFARRRGAGRVFLVGDFLDVQGPELEALVRPSRELFLVQILAREELTPALGAVRFVDAESGRARALAVDELRRASYERRLTAVLARLATLARRRALRLTTVTSDTPFERVVAALCDG